MFRIRPAIGLALLFGAAWLPGCAGPQAGDGGRFAGVARTADSPVRVELLRGLWDFFSLGLDSLAQELRDQGIDALARTGPRWPTWSAPILAGIKDGSDTRPLILVGHSYGSDDAVRMARFLNERGIAVKLLYLIDSTNPPPIPANVDRCIHLYMPNEFGRGVPQIFPGNPVVAEQGNDHTQIINTVFNEQNFGSAVAGTDHFNIEENPLVHQLITDEVLKVVAAVQSAQ